MSYKIEKVELAKIKQQLIDFRRKNFPDWPVEKFYWFYESNISGMTSCWVIRASDNDDIIGSAAVFSRKVWFHNKVLIAGITGDFGVAKMHRSLGPALLLQKSAIASCDSHNYDFLYGYSNILSVPVQKRAGFQNLGSAIRLVKLLRSYNYIKRYVRSHILAKIIACPIDIMLKLVSKETYSIPDKNLKTEIIKTFDDRFDDLWNKVAKSFVLIGERTSEYLKWRFFNSPIKEYKIFILTTKDELLGYVVFYISNNGVKIADFLNIDDNAFDVLLTMFLRFVRKNGYQTITIIYFGNEKFIDKCSKFSFMKRTNETNITVYLNPKNVLADVILEPNNWYFFEADNDS